MYPLDVCFSHRTISSTFQSGHIVVEQSIAQDFKCNGQAGKYNGQQHYGVFPVFEDEDWPYNNETYPECITEIRDYLSPFYTTNCVGDEVFQLGSSGAVSLLQAPKKQTRIQKLAVGKEQDYDGLNHPVPEPKYCGCFSFKKKNRCQEKMDQRKQDWQIQVQELRLDDSLLLQNRTMAIDFEKGHYHPDEQ